MTPERKAELIALSQAHRENPPTAQLSAMSFAGWSPRAQRNAAKAMKQANSK